MNPTAPEPVPACMKFCPVCECYVHESAFDGARGLCDVCSAPCPPLQATQPRMSLDALFPRASEIVARCPPL